MTDSARIIVREDERAAKAMKPTAPYAVMGALGTALFIAGATDLVLLWLPLRFGVPEWEFGTTARFLDGLPVISMGIAVLITWGGLTARRGLLWAMALVSALVLAFVIVGSVVFALDIPLALKATDLTLKLGIKKSIVKAGAEALTYGCAYLVFIVAAIRASRRTA